MIPGAQLKPVAHSTRHGKLVYETAMEQKDRTGSALLTMVALLRYLTLHDSCPSLDSLQLIHNNLSGSSYW